VNKRVVEALIKAGAFDALHPDRAAALASVGLAFDWADAQDVPTSTRAACSTSTTRTRPARRSRRW
jgi:DNA polymerase III alpha subunit